MNNLKETVIYKLVKDKVITNLEEVLNSPYPLLDSRVIDLLELEYTSHVISIRRVFKTVESGRYSSISLHMLIVGSNFIGFGFSNAPTFVDAKRIAINRAKLNICLVKLGHPLNSNTIPHLVRSKLGSTVVTLEPVNRGTGIVCAPKVKTLLSSISRLEVRIKKKGSSNPLNYYHALYMAFKQLN